MSNPARLATSPDEMLVGLVRGRAASGVTRLAQPHFHAFGGTVATARWPRAVVDGTFELPPRGGIRHERLRSGLEARALGASVAGGTGRIRYGAHKRRKKSANAQRDDEEPCG